jgi:hypothetical protein
MTTTTTPTTTMMNGTQDQCPPSSFNATSTFYQYFHHSTSTSTSTTTTKMETTTNHPKKKKRKNQQQQQQHRRTADASYDNYYYYYYYSIGMLHMGKTGGSVIASLLRNACHSKMSTESCEKPLLLLQSHDDYNNERILSKLVTHYYHIPRDRKRISHNNNNNNNIIKHNAWLVTTRDVHTRFVSALVYDHPRNMNALGLFNPKRRAIEMRFKQDHLYHCFPTLDRFGELVEQWYRMMSMTNSNTTTNTTTATTKFLEDDTAIDKNDTEKSTNNNKSDEEEIEEDEEKEDDLTAICAEKAYRLITGQMPTRHSMHLNQGYQKALTELRHVLGDKLVAGVVPSSVRRRRRRRRPPPPQQAHGDRRSGHLKNDTVTNYNNSSNETRPYIPLFVLRQEHLWHDWIEINALLGDSRQDLVSNPHTQQEQHQQSSPFSSESRMMLSRNTSGMSVQQLPVHPHQISNTSRWYFCRALQEEYRAYFHLLRLADNLADCPGAAQITADTVARTGIGATTTSSSSLSSSTSLSSNSLALNQAIAEAQRSCPNLNMTHVLLPPFE